MRISAYIPLIELGNLVTSRACYGRWILRGTNAEFLITAGGAAERRRATVDRATVDPDAKLGCVAYGIPWPRVRRSTLGWALYRMRQYAVSTAATLRGLR